MGHFREFAPVSGDAAGDGARDSDRDGDGAGWLDAAGICHPAAAAPARIVSLVPSLTELLFDLDLGDQVVGRTAYCVRPEGRVRRVRSVGGTKTVHLERIAGLAPTHVIVNVDETPRAVAEALADRGIRVIVTHPVTVDDNLALYRLLGGIFGRTGRAEALGRAFTAARARLRARVGERPPRPVLYLIWNTPAMTVSRETYISSCLAEAGLATEPAVADARYPEVVLDDALLDRLGLVLFASEPFPFRDRHLAAFASAFPAHRDKARLIDGQMVSWYGSRAIAAFGYLERLVAVGG